MVAAHLLAWSGLLRGKFLQPSVMTAEFTGEEILHLTGGRLAAGMMDDEAGAICTDTRTLVSGDWYIALAGRQFDGHDFLGDAFAAGAQGAIVQERTGYAIGNQQFPLIAVDDPLQSYCRLALNWRKRINPFVVAIAGSSGKSTTARMLNVVLSQMWRCHMPDFEDHDLWSVPKTIHCMPDDTQILIVEAQVGKNQDADAISCSLPDLGVITTVDTFEADSNEESDDIGNALASFLAAIKQRRGSVLVGNPNDALMSALQDRFDGLIQFCVESDIRILESSANAMTFVLPDCTQPFHLQGQGRPLMEDAWCVMMAARQKNLSDEQIADGLANFVK